MDKEEKEQAVLLLRARELQVLHQETLLIGYPMKDVVEMVEIVEKNTRQPMFMEDTVVKADMDSIHTDAVVMEDVVQLLDVLVRLRFQTELVAIMAQMEQLL